MNVTHVQIAESNGKVFRFGVIDNTLTCSFVDATYKLYSVYGDTQKCQVICLKRMETALNIVFALEYTSNGSIMHRLKNVMIVML